MDAQIAQIIDSGLPTHGLVRVVMQCWTWDDAQPIWQTVEATQDAAQEYLDAMTTSDRREFVAEVLVRAGWTWSRVCDRLS